METSRVSADCPHCGERIDLQIQVRASVAPPVKLPFQNAEQLTSWLQAGGLTIEEFRLLPIYAWYEAELEPLVAELKGSSHRLRVA